MSTVLVTAAFAAAAPFDGLWESNMVGYCSAAAVTGALGAAAPLTIAGVAIVAVGNVNVEGVNHTILVMPAGTAQNFFGQVVVTKTGGAAHTYTTAGAQFYPTGSDVLGLGIGVSLPGPTWIWTDGNVNFANGVVTTLDFPVSIVLTVPAFTSTEAVVDWTSSGGNEVYTVKRNGVAIATVTGALAYFDESLQPSTAYTYQIVGSDSGGLPVTSNAATITTTDLSDEFNCECETTSAYSPLSELRRRMMIQIGYAAQAANPPPGMVAYCNEYLFTAQNQLILKYPTLRTERLFKWTMVPGFRYYNLSASEGACAKVINPLRIKWVGFEDLNKAWYKLEAGIDPLMYTRAEITTGWPTRYEIRSCIEVFPAPQAAYTLWIKADFMLEPFAADADTPTIDDELVLLFAVANAKSDRGKPDAQRAMSQATSRMADLTAGAHTTKRYIPGGARQAVATPPRFLPLNGGPP